MKTSEHLFYGPPGQPGPTGPRPPGGKRDRLDAEGRQEVPHYMAGKWEVIDVIEGMMPEGLTPYQGMLWGNTVKYLMRFMLKGKPAEDLEKAETYMRWLRASIKKGLDRSARV